MSEGVQPDFRLVSSAEIAKPLEMVAELAVSNEELRTVGIPMSERNEEPGLGEYSASYIELTTREQFLLQRFDGHPTGGLTVLGRVAGDAHEQTVRLLAALNLPADRVTWEVPPEAWRDLQVRYGNFT